VLTIMPRDASQSGLVPRFGWVHISVGDAVPGTAVVICSGVRTEGLTGYRSFRLLANAPAQVGFPRRGSIILTPVIQATLARRPKANWRQSIHDAADWLRDPGGARRILRKLGVARK
jgi:hypothetical protein